MRLQEPDQRLYDGLPLARFTPDARRFWQRIFRLVLRAEAAYDGAYVAAAEALGALSKYC
jgi:hypothetical protein